MCDAPFRSPWDVFQIGYVHVVEISTDMRKTTYTHTAYEKNSLDWHHSHKVQYQSVNFTDWSNIVLILGVKTQYLCTLPLSKWSRAFSSAVEPDSWHITRGTPRQFVITVTNFVNNYVPSIAVIQGSVCFPEWGQEIKEIRSINLKIITELSLPDSLSYERWKPFRKALEVPKQMSANWYLPKIVD